jgi:hypothetical protein
VIVHEGPGNDSRSCRFPYLADSREKLPTVFVVPEDISSLYAANHNMMKRSGCIQSRLSWHGCILSRSTAIVNAYVNNVNYVPLGFYAGVICYASSSLLKSIIKSDPQSFLRCADGAEVYAFAVSSDMKTFLVRTSNRIKHALSGRTGRSAVMGASAINCYMQTYLVSTSLWVIPRLASLSAGRAVVRALAVGSNVVAELIGIRCWIVHTGRLRKA